jgi:hypothetical protein
LDVIRVQVCFAPHVVIGFVIERGFARSDVFTVESVARHVVGGPQKLVYSVLEKCSVVAVHVEFDRDSSPLLHRSYVGSGI